MRPSEAPWVNKCTIPKNWVITWPTATEGQTDRPSAPQLYQCLLSHFLALGAQEKADCTSMLCLIDSYQNKVSADQYYLTVSRAQVSTHQVRVFFWSYLLTTYSFSNDRRLRFFKIHIKYVVFMSLSPSTITILISNRPQTQNFSLFFLKYRRGRPFLTMVTCWSRSTFNFYALIG